MVLLLFTHALLDVVEPWMHTLFTPALQAPLGSSMHLSKLRVAMHSTHSCSGRVQELGARAYTAHYDGCWSAASAAARLASTVATLERVRVLFARPASVWGCVWWVGGWVMACDLVCVVYLTARDRYHISYQR